MRKPSPAFLKFTLALSSWRPWNDASFSSPDITLPVSKATLQTLRMCEKNGSTLWLGAIERGGVGISGS